MNAARVRAQNHARLRDERHCSRIAGTPHISALLSPILFRSDDSDAQIPNFPHTHMWRVKVSSVTNVTRAALEPSISPAKPAEGRQLLTARSSGRYVQSRLQRCGSRTFSSGDVSDVHISNSLHTYMWRVRVLSVTSVTRPPPEPSIDPANPAEGGCSDAWIFASVRNTCVALEHRGWRG
jgi:hypothetical protein